MTVKLLWISWNCISDTIYSYFLNERKAYVFIQVLKNCYSFWKWTVRRTISIADDINLTNTWNQSCLCDSSSVLIIWNIKYIYFIGSTSFSGLNRHNRLVFIIVVIHYFYYLKDRVLVVDWLESSKFSRFPE